MADTPQPVLVYNRIGANKRNTWLLLALFPLVVLPLISATGRGVFTPWLRDPAARYRAMDQAFYARLECYDRERFSTRDDARSCLAMAEAPMDRFRTEIVGASLVLASLTMIAIAGLMISRYGSRIVLRIARATPFDPDRDGELARTVENLCIGAGLPVPNIFLVESAAPNAFATGYDSERAALVVTRGLLTLLDHRELGGVIAHELSHIGNHDIRLTTTLAGLVSMASLPFTALWKAYQLVGGFGVVVVFGVFELVFGWVHGDWFGAGNRPFSPDLGSLVMWGVAVIGSPVYVLFVTPVAALLIRQAVSQEREFLADADAVRLTRDPDGLALALVKIGAAGGNKLPVSEGCAHLYFADPLETSLLHQIFPSHPPLASRIDLLTRMGTGIAPSVLMAAREAGRKFRQAQPESVDVRAALPDTDDGDLGTAEPPIEAPSHVESNNNSAHLPPFEETLTLVYERPDGWSRVVAQVPGNTRVTPVGSQGSFIRIVTQDNVTGYVARSARLPGLKLAQRLGDALPLDDGRGRQS